MAEMGETADGNPASVDFGGDSQEDASPAEGTGEPSSSHAGAAEAETKIQEGAMRPRRVEAALKAAKTFEEFRQKQAIQVS